MWVDLLILMIYHCSGCFSDRNQSELVSSNQKLVRNWSDSVPSGPIGIRLDKLDKFPTIWVVLCSRISDRNLSGSDWFHSENVGHRQDLAHTRRRILILSSLDPLLGMFMFRLVLHNNLNIFGSPASTVSRSAFRSAFRPAAVALTMMEEWRPQLVRTNPQKEGVQLGYETKDPRQVLTKKTQA